MNELSQRATILVRMGRGAMQPSMADRDRISAMLRARLGDAVLPFEAGTVTLLLSRFAWAKLYWAVAAVGIGSGAALLASQTDAPLTDPAPALPVARVASAVPAPEKKVSPALEVPESPPVARQESAAPALRKVGDHLGQEVSILSRATGELHAGHAASALKAVEEHERRFPNGMLVQERRVARAQALRALGRCDAQSELCDAAPSPRP